MGPDPLFAHPRLAALYDAFEGERPDLQLYAALAREFGARRLLDIGCGTGTFACRMAGEGFDVVGIDPAEASLAIARRKPHAEQVRWICAGASDAPAMGADMAVMTGNVAQVFVEDESWRTALGAVRDALDARGRLVFETRDPGRQAWRKWTRADTFRRSDVAGGVSTWCEVTGADAPCVAFRWTFAFDADGVVLTSDSVLRFRTRAEIEKTLGENGFTLEEVRDAPDRPGQEFVFIARRA